MASGASGWRSIDKLARSSGVCRKPAWLHASYSTPCIYQDEGGRPQLVFSSNAHGLTGVDPETGRVLWEVRSALPYRVVSSPVIAGDLVIAACGEGGGGKRLSAVRVTREDSTYQAKEVYALDSRIVPYVPTSVAYQGMLFTFHDGGVVSCLASDSGEVLWSEKPAGRYYGSPICVDGKLYCVTIDGDVVVLAAEKEYKLAGRQPAG